MDGCSYTQSCQGGEDGLKTKWRVAMEVEGWLLSWLVGVGVVGVSWLVGWGCWGWLL